MTAKKKPTKRPTPPPPKPPAKKKPSMPSSSRSPGASQVQNRQRSLENEIIRSGLIPKPKRGQSLASLTKAAKSQAYGRLGGAFTEEEWNRGPGKQGYDAALASAAKKVWMMGQRPAPKKK